MISIEEYAGWDGREMAHGCAPGTSPLAELEAACREQIERIDPTVNARRRPGTHGDRRRRRTDGAFAGVPFAVKELLAVPGLPWTMVRASSPATRRRRLAYVERLLTAGLRIVASTTSSEFGLLGSTESTLRGATVNPWDDGLSAGGSSGGAAAAVAAGIVPLAHANDAGGSIRY